jgi:2-methylcitrate dehydratase PrpD
MTAAETIAAYAISITLDDVPEEVVEHAKLHVLDALGCGLAAHATGNGIEGRATMHELGGEGQATVIGLVDRLPAVNAAFANAMICHGLDFDDTHSDSGSHISTVIAPAAFAAAELYGAGGKDVLAAIVAGNEIACRIGMAAPGAFHARGFHPTAIGGVFGATAAASRLAGFDAKTATSALGIAGSMASGIFAYLADGTPTKPIHPGWAAHGAHIATRLAHHGAAGPRSVFDAQFGIYHAYLGIEPGSSGLAGSARGSREPLGDAADRVQAVPDLPLHPRRRRRRRRRGGGAHLRGGRDRRGRRQRAGALGADRARAGRREEDTGGPSTRASSRCSTPSRRCSCADMWV